MSEVTINTAPRDAKDVAALSVFTQRRLAEQLRLAGIKLWSSDWDKGQFLHGDAEARVVAIARALKEWDALSAAAQVPGSTPTARSRGAEPTAAISAPRAPAPVDVPRIETVPLSRINLDADTQSRESISNEAVVEYSQALSAGIRFPAVVLFEDESGQLFVGDGHHTVLAASVASLESVEAEVRRGTCRDAILYSVGCNATHGVRRTIDDKRHAVQKLLRDPEWRLMSDRWIAEMCKVSNKFVSGLRREHEAAAGEPLSSEGQSAGRIGRDGKVRRAAKADATPAGVDAAPQVIGAGTAIPEAGSGDGIASAIGDSQASTDSCRLGIDRHEILEASARLAISSHRLVKKVAQFFKTVAALPDTEAATVINIMTGLVDYIEAAGDHDLEKLSSFIACPGGKRGG